MKKILLSFVAMVMATATFAQSWVGTQFEISAGGGVEFSLPDDAVRVYNFSGQWGSISPQIKDFSNEVYKEVVVELEEALEYQFNTPYKDKDAVLQWHATATDKAGSTKIDIDITSLVSITDFSIQFIQSGTGHISIKKAYAVKNDDTKVPLVFSAGWGVSMTVVGYEHITSGNANFSSQWGGINIDDAIIGKAGKKTLRIYTLSDITESPVQWCIRTAGGADAWPQIGKQNANYAECTIKDNLSSIFLQWTSATKGEINIDAITWELTPFASTTLNAEGYATFSAEDDLYVATAGVTAYKAVVDGENITLEELDNPTIPAGTGVILYGTPGTLVEFDYDGSKAKATNLADNALKATTTATENIVSKPAGTLWALGTGNEFQKYTGADFIANRAFLVHETAAANMRMVIEDEATGISEVKSIKKENCKILENGKVIIVKNGVKYNVSGQQVK